jgi:hypothetical protein
MKFDASCLYSLRMWDGLQRFVLKNGSYVPRR